MFSAYDCRVPARATFRRRDRLTHDREFDAVYAARCRRARGPLAVFALGTDRAHPRLGLAVSRRVGTAVARNTIKRRLREAFRLSRGDLAAREGGNYDFVVSVRAHEPLAMSEYRELFVSLAKEAAGAWDARAARRSGGAP